MPSLGSSPLFDAVTRGLRRTPELLRLAGVVLTRSRQDNLLQKSAALAYVSLISLIPLLATFSFVGARLFGEHREVVLHLVTGLLPWSQDAVIAKIEEFLAQAETLVQIGILGFAAVTISMFGSIESTINQIWRVGANRPLRVRLMSTTLLLFWGPVVVGSGISLLLVLRRRPGFDVLFEESIVLQAAPFALSAVGLSMLYWLVPNTRVGFRNAALGGVTAALLIELLRRGFGIYTELYRAYSWFIYGSLALLLFFVLSVQLGWLSVLLGCEVAYVVQHRDALSPNRRRSARFLRRWIGLAVSAILAKRLLAGRPGGGADELAGQLELPPDLLQHSLEPLLAGGVLEEAGDDDHRYRLAVDPHTLAIEAIFACYEQGWEELLTPLEDDVGKAVERCRLVVLGSRRESLNGLTLATLLDRQPDSEENASPLRQAPEEATR